MSKVSKNTITVLILLAVAALFIVVPLFMQSEAEFGGSDGAGSEMVESIDDTYTPWFTPVAESALGREIPGEVESMLFCLQTAIGVGIIAFFMGRFYQRKKQEKKDAPEA